MRGAWQTVTLLLFLLVGCQGVNPCWSCSGGGGGTTEPPFQATLEPSFLQVARGGEGVLRVTLKPEHLNPFTLVICLQNRGGGHPPRGITLWGKPPEPWDPGSCLLTPIGGGGEARLEVVVAVAPEVAPGIYPLRLRLENEAALRLLDFTLRVL